MSNLKAYSKVTIPHRELEPPPRHPARKLDFLPTAGQLGSQIPGLQVGANPSPESRFGHLGAFFEFFLPSRTYEAGAESR